MSFLPPGVTSSTLAAFPQIVYDRYAIKEWHFNTPFLAELCDFRPIPRRSGRTLQLWGQKPFGAATSTLSEGIPGPSLSLSQVYNDVFADEYGDYLTISNVAQEMFISDPVVEAVRNLSYRGALTGNQVVSTAFDNAAAADATARIDLADNEFANSQTYRRAEGSLINNAVPNRNGGMYTSVISPLMVYDLISDNSAGGITDVMKRTPQGTNVLVEGQSVGYQVLEWSGIRLIRTPTVPTYANYPSSGKTGYGSLVVGNEVMFASELAGVQAPRDERFKVKVKYENEISPANPMGQTAALVAYDFFLGVASRPNTNGTSGFRRIRGEVGIV